jgi:tetratricopeptide (TPR) repeat protein
MTVFAARRMAFSFALMMAMAAPFALAQTDPRTEATTLEREGRNAEAEALWKTFSAQHPAEAEPYAHIGQLAARQEHYSEAIASYRKAMAIAPGMPGLRPNLGLAYFKNGDYKQAIAMFGPMLKERPGDSKLTLLVGMSHYGLGEYAAATPYLKQAAEADAPNLALQMTLAHSCMFAKEYPCVLDAFHRILTIDANSAEAHVLAGEALDGMKDPLGAQREFRAAIAADPKLPNVHFGLGYLLWTKGQNEEAAEQFQTELANNPQHALSMLYLADAQMKLGKAAEAQALLEKVVKLAPQNAMAHRDLGNIYAERGQNAAAVEQLQEAIRLAPNDASAHWRLARLYRAMGKSAAASAEFEKTKSLNKAEDEHLVKIMSQAPN